MKDARYSFFAETLGGDDSVGVTSPQEAVKEAIAMGKRTGKRTRVRVSLDNIKTGDVALHEESFEVRF